MATNQNTTEVSAMPPHIEAVMIARDAIVKALQGCSSGSGKMECPVCKTGELWYTRSGSRGHIGASCTTEGCVAWRE